MEKIYLIDANSFIYRMFFGMPEFTTKNWKVVNAVFGIARFFLEQLVREKPDYILFIKDAKWWSFRDKIDSNYKATRDKMPDNLRSQIPIIEDMVKKMKVPIIEISWVEADDVIWTIAKKYSWNKDYEIDILTWDKDLYSLISNNVKIYDTMKKKKFGIEETKEKFWVTPKMIIDYLAIVWDKADNIPWIEWFWPKKAVDLINIIWWVENIYNFIKVNNFENITEKDRKEILEFRYWEEAAKKIFWIFKWKTFEKLIKSKENAFLSKKLATIKLNVDINNFDLNNYKFNPWEYLNNNVEKLFDELEFHSLLWKEAPKLKNWEDLNLDVNIIDDDNKLLLLLSKIKKYKKIVFDTETTSLSIIKAQIVWISIYLDDKNLFYINRLHRWNKVSDLILKEFLQNLFNLDITIIGHNIKYDLEIVDLFLKNNFIKNIKEETQKTLF